MVKIFAHRGFATKHCPENSILALKKAHEMKFDGVEFDLWFIDGEFVVVHDHPSHKQIKNLPRLADFLQFHNDFYYWLDFKNLNSQNYIAAISRVRQDIILSKIDLDRFYFAPYIDNYNFAKEVFYQARRLIDKKLKITAIFQDKNKYQQLKSLIKNENMGLSQIKFKQSPNFLIFLLASKQH